MDELTLLREMQSDIAAPTAEALAPGREALLRRIESSHSPKRVAIHRLAPLRTLLISATAATATAVVVIGSLYGFGGPHGQASAQAAEVLNDAAAQTIITSDPVVAPGQYKKIETTAQFLDGVEGQDWDMCSQLDSETDQLYIPADPTDEWVWNRPARVPITVFGGADCETAAATSDAGIPAEVLRANNGEFNGSPPLVADPSALPRDPLQLLHHFQDQARGAGSSLDAETFVVIADYLRTGTVPADLRAALYEVLALIPGVDVIDRQATLDGRTGIAIGRDASYGPMTTRSEIIIDPSTGLVIGEREVVLQAEGPVPVGTAITSTSVLTMVVDSAPDDVPR
jgi:RNA polymerase sigma-70 factor (ECF subfamily)